jgi:hypothetical protein
MDVVAHATPFSTALDDEPPAGVPIVLATELTPDADGPYALALSERQWPASVDLGHAALACAWVDLGLWSRARNHARVCAGEGWLHIHRARGSSWSASMDTAPCAHCKVVLRVLEGREFAAELRDLRVDVGHLRVARTLARRALGSIRLNRL